MQYSLDSSVASPWKQVFSSAHSTFKNRQVDTLHVYIQGLTSVEMRSRKSGRPSIFGVRLGMGIGTVTSSLFCRYRSN